MLSPPSVLSLLRQVYVLAYPSSLFLRYASFSQKFRCHFSSALMASSLRMLGRFTVVFYIVIPLAAITTLYTVLFRLDRAPRSQDLFLSPLLSSSEPLSGSAFPSLRHLCNETDWTEGLWLQCHNNVGPSKTAMRGGLSNLGNRMQTCVRLAISAGAGVIVTPPFS